MKIFHIFRKRLLLVGWIIIQSGKMVIFMSSTRFLLSVQIIRREIEIIKLEMFKKYKNFPSNYGIQNQSIQYLNLQDRDFLYFNLFKFEMIRLKKACLKVTKYEKIQQVCLISNQVQKRYKKSKIMTKYKSNNRQLLTPTSVLKLTVFAIYLTYTTAQTIVDISYVQGIPWPSHIINCPSNFLLQYLSDPQHIHIGSTIESSPANQNSTRNKISQNFLSSSYKTGSIDELVELIKKGIIASQKTQGKDVVVSFSKTGAGKSTITHFLAGIKIIDTSNKKSKKGLVNIANPQPIQTIPGFSVGSGKQSETRLVNVLELQDFPFADTCGLSDTQGFNYDLANTISLQKVFHNAESVRILLLIKQSSIEGDQRGATLIKLITQIVGYIKKIKVEDFIPSVTILITHIVYRSSEITQSLRQILQAQKKSPTIEDSFEREKVLKFISAMIQGSELDALRQEVQDLQEIITQLEIQIQASELDVIQEKIQKFQQKIQLTKNRINKKKTSDDFRQQIQEWSTDLEFYEEQILTLTKLKKHSQLQLQKLSTNLQKKRAQLLRKNKQITLAENQYKTDKQSKTKCLFNQFISFSVQKLLSESERQKLIKVLKFSPRIQNPKQHFQISINNQLQLHAQNMAYQIFQDLYNDLRQFNYDVAQSRLNHILFLSEHIITDDFQKYKQKCINLAKNFLQENCNFFRRTLTDSLSQNGILTEEGMETISKIIKRVYNASSLSEKLPQFDNDRNSFNGLYGYFMETFKKHGNSALTDLSMTSKIFTSSDTFIKLKRLAIRFKAQFPTLITIYEDIGFQILDLIESRMKQTRESISNYNHRSLSEDLTFFSAFKDMMTLVFGQDISLEYQNIINLSINSFRQRYTIKFDQLIENLTVDKIENISSEYRNLSYHLNNDKQLHQYIAKQVLEECMNRMREVLVNKSLEQIQKMKESIQNSKFQDLQQQMNLLKEIRNVDNSIASSTYHIYVIFLSRLLNDLTTRSQIIIEGVMAKVRLGSVTIVDVESLKSVLNKLSKMDWLGSLIGTQGLTQLIQDTTSDILRHAEEISSNLNNTFLKELQFSQKFKSKDLQFFYSQFDHLDQQNQTQLYQIQFQTFQKKLKFLKVNSALSFVQKLGQINEKLQQINLKSKELVQNLIKKQLQKVSNSIEQHNETFQINKANLNRHIIRLSSMKQINIDLSKEIEDTLKSIQTKIVQHFKRCSNTIKDQNLQDSKTFVGTVNSYLMLINSLRPCDNFLIKRGIDIKFQKESLILNIRNIFFGFYEEMDEQIKNQKINETRQSLIIFKNYRNTIVDRIVKDQISQKYSFYMGTFNQMVSVIPIEIMKLLNNGQFQELLIVFKDLCSDKGNERACRNVQNEIDSKILREYKQIIDDLTGIYEEGNQEFEYKGLNNQIKEFNRYQDIISIISHLNYTQKKNNIISELKNLYQFKKTQIKEDISQSKFKRLKIKVDMIVKFHKVLLKGIQAQDYFIEKFDARKQLEGEINEIINGQIGNQWSKCFVYLDKLKQIDEQFQTQDGSNYQTKIKKQLLSILNKTKEEAQSANTTEHLYQYKTNLLNLKNQTYSFIIQNPFFIDLQDQFKNTETMIDQLIQILGGCSDFDQQCLARLKVSHFDKYSKIVREKQEFYKKCRLQIQQSLKIKNYQNLASLLTQLNKFDQIKYHLRLSNQEMPLTIKEKTFQQIFNRIKSLEIQVSQIVKHKPVSNEAADSVNFIAIQEYLKIFENINFEDRDYEDLVFGFNQFHKDVYGRVLNVIPKIQENSTIKAHEQRLNKIKSYSNFIDLFKKYIDRIKTLNKETLYLQLSSYPNFVEVISQVHGQNQMKQKIQQILANLPDQITNLWKYHRFQPIRQVLYDVKNLNQRYSNRDQERLITLVQKLIEQTADQILTSFNNRQLFDVTNQISNLKKAENQFKLIRGMVQNPSKHQQIIEIIDRTIKKETVQKALQKIDKKVEVQSVALDLIHLKKWVVTIPVLDPIIQEHIKQILRDAKVKKIIQKISGGLEQQSKDKANPQNARIGAQILHSYSSLLNIPRVLPKPTKRIEDLITDIKGGDIDQSQLINIFRIYTQQFSQLIKKYVSLSDKESIPKNLKSIKAQVDISLKEIESSNKIKNEKSRLQIPKLIAKIFAYISIMKTGPSYFDALSHQQPNADTFLLQPHTIQILSIFRFMGCDKKGGWFQNWFGGFGEKIVSKNKIQNHFMQINTGQGKSIILGAMSLLFSLMGHEVYSVCYSASLSSRDYSFFQEVFQAFNVTDRVKYGTFSEISEMIINQHGDIRTLVKNLYSTETKLISNSNNTNQLSRRRVLLVDQVDNFFKKQFYGNTYNPCTFINSPNIVEIIKFIWSNKEENVEQIKSLMQNTSFYQKLKEQFNDCFQKIKRQLDRMAKDVKKYNFRDYLVQKDAIGYKELDGISFNTVHGYETMFSYMHEHDLGRITHQKVKANLGIILSCGYFSYAQMIDSFDMIFGVTGTLEDLTSFQQDILKRYKITTRTYMPSVYGDSLRSQKRIQIIKDENNHHARLKQIITQRINNQQAVLVFFQNQNTLLKFSQSGYAEDFKNQMNIVTEKTQFRDHFIKRATSSQLITLFTASFGRGTDFVVYDPITKDKGVCVIQTFLSEQLSQQKQIKGRTARQGAIGDYQMIINYEHLHSKFGITHEMTNKTHSNFQLEMLFKEKRNQFTEKTNSQRIQRIQRSMLNHQHSMQMRNKIIKNQVDRNSSFFFKRATKIGKTRIAIAIDSTGSMGPIIQAVKGKVMAMIEKLATHYPNQFQIQILFYYGHYAYSQNNQDSQSQWYITNRLHVSPWSDQVKVLSQFLKTAIAKGGSEHEAIEVALHHFVMLNKEVGINRAILIGDAGRYGRLDSNLTYKVHSSEASRYQKSEIEKPLFLVLGKLLKELQQRQVSVDTYAIGVGQLIRKTCQQISEITQGKLTLFDPKKDDLAAEIEETIMQEIIMRK